MNLNKIITHLGDYKEESLKISECGEWWGNKKKYRYILPIAEKYENIIDAGFKEDLKNLISNNSVHLGFHHLNSSQALALNLLGPLVITKNLKIIDLSEDFDNNTASFEYIEDKNEQTNFDFFVTSQNNKNYFEVKYTEHNFGSANDDKNHRQKYLEIYKSQLENISNISEKEFFKNYQLWRNIIYAQKGNVYFVLPRFREDLFARVKDAKEKILNPEINDRVKVLIIDDLVAKCKEKPDLQKHYEEFEKKYSRF